MGRNGLEIHYHVLDGKKQDDHPKQKPDNRTDISEFLIDSVQLVLEFIQRHPVHVPVGETLQVVPVRADGIFPFHVWIFFR